jgi:hypothetical protein
MKSLRDSGRRGGPPRLEPFVAPVEATPSLEGVTKTDLLNEFMFINLRVAQTNTQAARESLDIQNFALDGLEGINEPEAQRYTIGDYAKEVAAELGPIPSFSILEKGEAIPITLDDVEVASGQHSASGECDRPALLGLGSDGQCVPYSRIGRLPGLSPASGQPDPNIQWIFIARRYKIRANPDDPIFEDVAIIGHHRQTGFTAFFQMLDTINGKDASRIPSPMEPASETPGGFPTAEEFWLPPVQTAGIGCNRCHDSDPFIHTPYVDQVRIKSGAGSLVPIVPSSAKGHYKFVGSQAFTSWKKPNQFKPAGNLCITCHRIGTSASSESFAQWATGDTFPSQLSKAYKTYPNSHWMPPGESESMTKEEWGTLYKSSLLQLLSCNQNSAQAVCKLQEIQ